MVELREITKENSLFGIVYPLKISIVGSRKEFILWVI